MGHSPGERSTWGAISIRDVGVAGIGLVILGGALLLISFTTSDWYGGSGGADSVGHITFTTLHRLTADHRAPALVGAYFGWLAWALLILVIVLGLAANLPSPAVVGLRVGGFFLGLLGAALTFVALSKLVGPGASVLTRMRSGVWLAVLGYVMAAVGAMLGPRARAML